MTLFHAMLMNGFAAVISKIQGNTQSTLNASGNFAVVGIETRLVGKSYTNSDIVKKMEWQETWSKQNIVKLILTLGQKFTIYDFGSKRLCLQKRIMCVGVSKLRQRGLKMFANGFFVVAVRLNLCNIN